MIVVLCIIIGFLITMFGVAMIIAKLMIDEADEKYGGGRSSHRRKK